MTHSSSSRPRQLLLVTTLLGTLAAPPLWAAVSTFNVNVPRKSGGSLKQISQIVVTAQVDSTAPIDFTITPPAGHGSATATGPMQPAVAPPHVSLFFGVVQVYPPDTTGLAANDPRRRNYKFVISPTFDFDANCLSTPMLGDETWQVAVTGGSSRVTDACSVSFDENVLGNECNGALRPVPLNEAVAELGGLSSQEQTCRFGVDAMLVLDRSGSMSSRSNVNQPVSATNTRIVSLRNAVQSFVSTLNSVRAAESTTFATVSNDQVGAVIFNQDAADLPGLASGLNTFNATTASALTGGINGTNPSGSTSIGDGLLSAAGALGGAAPDRRRVILLMSDGLQNTDQRVGANVATHSVFTHPSGMASGPNLPNLSNFQIYTVTVGNGMAVNAQVNQDIALATGGFYLNSEDDAGQLPTFFGGLLQNFLETTTWQTVLAGADKASLAAPFTATVPITTTTQAVVVTVTPKDRRSRLCLVVTPPTGTALQPTCGSGVLTSAFTAASVQALGGAWQIRVQPQVGDNAPGDHFFNLLVIADDLGTGARVTTSSATYAPGDPIRVEAKLSELGTAIVGLDPNQLRVSLASPTRTLGEIMAASTAPTTQPAGDTADDATAKLQNEIETNPAVLDQTHSSVSLRDDGTGGDRTAGDGVYSAEFTVRNYGHVGLDVTLQGASPHGGGLRRQRLETLFLKAIPSGGATGVSSQVITDGDTRRLVMTITPRNRFRAPIGPGWANHIWLTAPGHPPFKPKDNLDSTYTASLAFGPGPVPDVSIHFIPDSVLIGDSVPPEGLPRPLDGSTVLVPHASAPALGPGWSLSLHGGFNAPRGSFADACDGGASLGVDLEYRFTSTLAAELFYGHDRFDCAGDGSTINHLSVNGKVYFLPGSPWRPFAGAGTGRYDFSSGPSETGFNVFAGVQGNPLARLAVEGTIRFHFVDQAGVESNFLTAHLGLRVRF